MYPLTYLDYFNAMMRGEVFAWERFTYGDLLVLSRIPQEVVSGDSASFSRVQKAVLVELGERNAV